MVVWEWYTRPRKGKRVTWGEGGGEGHKHTCAVRSFYKEEKVWGLVMNVEQTWKVLHTMTYKLL